MCFGTSAPVVAAGAGRSAGREYSNEPSTTGGGLQMTPAERSQANSVAGFKSAQAFDAAQRAERLGQPATVAPNTITSSEQASLDYRRPRTGSTNAALLTAGNKLLGG